MAWKNFIWLFLKKWLFLAFLKNSREKDLVPDVRPNLAECRLNGGNGKS